MGRYHDAQIGVRLPAEVVERLRREAAADERSVSAVVRRLLRVALEERREADEKAVHA